MPGSPEFHEHDHPRDQDGTFTSKATPAVPSQTIGRLSAQVSNLSDGSSEDEAFTMGQRAFAEHRDRVVPRELLVGNGEVGNGIAAARRWYRGWDAANLADSSDPDPDALVSPGELDKHGRWVDPDDEFGHDLDEAAWGAGLPDDGDEDDDNEDRLLAGPSSSHGPGPAPRNSLGKRFADRLRRR